MKYRSITSWNKAFTLIELLVVIAIIALLMSVVVPALSKAKEQSRKAVCSSNLHQRGIAELAYATANKQNLFPTPLVGVTKGLPYTISRDLSVYLKKQYSMESKFWMCPSLDVQSNRSGPSTSLNKVGAASHPHLIRSSDTWIPPKLRVVGELMPLWIDGGSISQTEVVVGYYMLSHMANSAYPVKESPTKATDSGRKHLSADLNVKWETWSTGPSVVAHRDRRTQAPVGGNRLYLDAHVEWMRPDRMGYKDESIDTGRPKYTWAQGYRWCFW